MPDEVNDSLLRVVKARTAALISRDAARLGALLAPSFVYINSNGRRLDKAQYLQSALSAVWISQTLSEERISLHGPVAILTGKVHDIAKFPEGELDTDFLTTQVYQRTGDSWIYLAGHTSVPPSP